MIEDEVNEIEDDEVRLICHEHYILGWTWEAVSARVKDSEYHNTVRYIVNKYFEDKEKA